MIAGYIAYRVRKKYPGKASKYGCITRDISLSGKNWLETISRGSLMKPTQECVDSVTKMEEEFARFHGGFVNQCPGVFRSLNDRIKSKHPDIDEFVVQCFVRTRTFIRIKRINKSRDKRRRSDSERRKKTKKFKKVVQ